MSRLKHSLLFRVISLVLIAAFISLDIAYAYPRLEHDAGGSTLAVPSINQSNPINEQAAKSRESVRLEASVVATICEVARHYFIRSYSDFRPYPFSHAADDISAKLGPQLGRAGIRILCVGPVENIRNKNGEFKTALGAIGFNREFPKKEVLFILYERRGKKFLVQVAKKGQVSDSNLPGYSLPYMDKYVVKYVPVNYEESALAPIKESEQLPVPDAELAEAPQAINETPITKNAFSNKLFAFDPASAILFAHIVIQAITDIVAAHPIITTGAAVAVGVAAVSIAWRRFFPLSWHLLVLRQSGSDSIRASAVDSIMGLARLDKYGRVMPILLRALGDNNNNVTRGVMDALVKIGPLAGQPLRAALGYKNNKIRWNAFEALRRLGYSNDKVKAKRYIADLRYGDANIRNVAVMVLSRMAPLSTAAHILITDALVDTDSNVRDTAYCVLGQLGILTAEQRLRRFITDIGDASDSDVRIRAAIALIKIGDKRLSFMDGYLDTIADKPSEFYRFLTPRQIKYILSCLKHNKDIEGHYIHYKSRTVTEPESHQTEMLSDNENILLSLTWLPEDKEVVDQPAQLTLVIPEDFSQDEKDTRGDIFGKNDSGDSLYSIHPLAVKSSIALAGYLLFIIRDFAYTYPAITLIAGSGIAIASFLALWRRLYPVSYHSFWIKSDIDTCMHMEALAKIGARGVPAIIKALRDDNPQHRISAVSAINTTSHEAWEGLLITGGEIERALIDALEDSDSNVRRIAFYALERFKPLPADLEIKRYIADLRDASKHTRKSAARALENLDAFTAELKAMYYIAGLEDGDDEYYDVLTPGEREEILERLESDRIVEGQHSHYSDVFIDGAKALSSVTWLSRPKKAAPEGRGYGRSRIGFLHPLVSVGYHLLWIKLNVNTFIHVKELGKIGPPAIPALIKILRNGDPSLRRSAVIAIRIAGFNTREGFGTVTAGAVPALIAALEDSDARVRELAYNALDKFKLLDKGLKIRRYIVDIRDTKKPVRRDAARELENLEAFTKELQIKYYIIDLGDEDSEVRKVAAQRLNNIWDGRPSFMNDYLVTVGYWGPEYYDALTKKQIKQILYCLNNNINLEGRYYDIVYFKNNPGIQVSELPHAQEIDPWIPTGLQFKATPAYRKLKVDRPAHIEISVPEASINPAPSDRPLIGLLPRIFNKKFGVMPIKYIIIALHPLLVAAKDYAVTNPITTIGIGVTIGVVLSLAALRALFPIRWQIIRLHSGDGHAVRALLKIGPNAVPALMKELKNGDSFLRASITKALGNTGPITSEVTLALIDALRDALRDSDSNVRSSAAEILGAIGAITPYVIPDLEDALRDKDSNVRSSAARALGNIGPTDLRAISSLMDMLGDPDRTVRDSVVYALGMIGTPVVPYLIAALGSDDIIIRHGATEALVNIGLPSVPYLINALKNDNGNGRGNIRSGIIVTLDKIGPVIPAVIPAFKSALNDSDSKVRENAADILERRGFLNTHLKVRRYLADLKDSDKYVRESAVKSLGAIGPVGPVEAAKIVPLLMKVLRNRYEDEHVRASAAEALGEVGAIVPEVVTALIIAMQPDDSGTAMGTLRPGNSDAIRSSAAKALGKIGPVTPKVVPALINASLRDLDHSVRMSATEALSAVDSVAVTALFFIGVVENDLEYTHVRRNAIDSLGEIGCVTPEVVPAIIAALECSNTVLSEGAAEALGKIGPVTPEVIPALIKVLKVSSNLYATVRRNAITSLGIIGSANPGCLPAITPAIIGALDDTDDLVRNGAAYALGTVGPMRPNLEVIIALIKALGDPLTSVRMHAAYALSKITDKRLSFMSDYLEIVSSRTSEDYEMLSPEDIRYIVECLKDGTKIESELMPSALARVNGNGNGIGGAREYPILRSAEPFTIASIIYAVGQLYLAARDFAAAHPIVTIGFGIVIAVVSFYAAWQKLFPVNWNLHVIRNSSNDSDRAFARKAIINIGESAIPELEQALTDENRYVRKISMEILEKYGHMTQELKIRRYIADLQDSSDLRIQKTAIDKLIAMNPMPSEAIETMLDALIGNDASLSGYVAAAFGKMKPAPQEVRNGLIEALGDHKIFVRKNAVLALGMIEKNAKTSTSGIVYIEVVDALIAVLGDDDVGADAMREISLMDRSAIPALQEILKDRAGLEGSGPDAIEHSRRRASVRAVLKKIGSAKNSSPANDIDALVARAKEVGENQAPANNNGSADSAPKPTITAESIIRDVEGELKDRRELTGRELSSADRFILIRTRIPDLLEDFKNLRSVLDDLSPLSEETIVPGDEIPRAIAKAVADHKLSPQEAKVLWLALTGSVRVAEPAPVVVTTTETDPHSAMAGAPRIAPKAGLGPKQLIDSIIDDVKRELPELAKSAGRDVGSVERYALVRSKVPKLTWYFDNLRSALDDKEFVGLSTRKDVPMDIIDKAIAKVSAKYKLFQEDTRILRLALTGREQTTESAAEERAVSAHTTDQLFDIVESSLKSRSAKFIEDANKLIRYVNLNSNLGKIDIIGQGDELTLTAAEIRQRVERAISAAEKLANKPVLPGGIKAAIDSVKSGLDQFEADRAVVSLIVLARDAKRNGQKLTIYLEANLASGADVSGATPDNVIGTGDISRDGVIRAFNMEMAGIVKTLNEKGLTDVEIVYKDRAGIADALREEAAERNGNLRNIVFLGSRDTVNVLKELQVFKGVGMEKRPFLAGIDLDAAVTGYKGNSADEAYLGLMSLFCLTLELAAGKKLPSYMTSKLAVGEESPQIPVTASYDVNNNRIVTFFSSAKPVNINKIADTRNADKIALSAA